jgi:hypothetical protein
VRESRYVMTLHADDEMEEDGLRIIDVGNALLTGRIMRRQPIDDRANGSAWCAVGAQTIRRTSWRS